MRRLLTLSPHNHRGISLTKALYEDSRLLEGILYRHPWVRGSGWLFLRTWGFQVVPQSTLTVFYAPGSKMGSVSGDGRRGRSAAGINFWVDFHGGSGDWKAVSCSLKARIHFEDRLPEG